MLVLTKLVIFFINFLISLVNSLHKLFHLNVLKFHCIPILYVLVYNGHAYATHIQNLLKYHISSLICSNSINIR